MAQVPRMLANVYRERKKALGGKHEKDGVAVWSLNQCPVHGVDQVGWRGHIIGDGLELRG